MKAKGRWTKKAELRRVGERLAAAIAEDKKRRREWKKQQNAGMKLFEWKEVSAPNELAKTIVVNEVLLKTIRKACTHLTIALRAYDKNWRSG